MRTAHYLPAETLTASGRPEGFNGYTIPLLFTGSSSFGPVGAPLSPCPAPIYLVQFSAERAHRIGPGLSA